MDTKISLITICLNNVETIEDTIKSVIGQTYDNIEYIVIDGGYTDGTNKIINKYASNINKTITGDDDGIYDALNRGIRLSSGDVIGILHADDVFANKFTISRVMSQFDVFPDIDMVYGDLVYVNNEMQQRRYWRSNDYKRNSFKSGWMPPHPTAFVKKDVFRKYGLYDLKYDIASDYEWLLRLIHKNDIKTRYLPVVITKMRVGGTSNRLSNKFKIIKEEWMAWKNNGYPPNIRALFLKKIGALIQYLNIYDR